MSLACAHCGLPLKNKKISLDSPDGKLHFCCQGCKMAWQMLNVPGVSKDKVMDEAIDALEIGHAMTDESEPVPWEFSVDGMVCEACVPIVRRILARTSGIESVRVNFLTGRANIEYKPGVIGKAKIKKRLARFGYNVAAPGDDGSELAADSLIRVSLGLFLAMDIMFLSVPEYFQAFGPGEMQWRYYLRLAMLGLSLPIMLWVAMPIFLKGYAALVTLRPDMNFLVSLGTASAFGYSAYSLATNGPHVYFETAAFLPVMISVGKALEERARRKARESLTGLIDVVPRVALLVKGGDEREVAPETLAAGDLVYVGQGDTVPTDGVVADGDLLLDESIITGESEPRPRAAGDPVRAGARVISGSARMEVSAPLEESLIAQVVSSLERSELFRGKRQVLLDLIVAVMAPSVIMLGLGAAAGVYFAGGGWEDSMIRALSVILFACPCALSLAAPIAHAAAIGRAASMGVVVRDGQALELGRNPTRLVIDKTGTLTMGRPVLTGVRTAPGMDMYEAIAAAAALEQGSSHPMAETLLALAQVRGIVPPHATDAEDVPGLGRRGYLKGVPHFIGNERMLESEGAHLAAWAREAADEARAGGLSISWLARGESPEVVAVFGFADEVRPEAPAAVAALIEEGVTPVLATGDHEAAARPVAEACGITELYANMMPDDKRDLVVRLKEEGHVVWVAGDGINDAPALAAAEMGIAMGKGAALASESAHLTLASDELSNLPRLLELTDSTTRVVKQNLAWAVLYNGIGLPLAFTGLLQPLFSALAMMVSSLSVVLNSLRLRGE